MNTFSEQIFLYAKTKSNKKGISIDENSYTYEELANEIKKTEKIFNCNIEDKTVAIYTTSVIEQLVVFLAVENAKGIPLLLHDYLNKNEINNLLNTYKIPYLFSNGKIIKTHFAKQEISETQKICENIPERKFAVLSSGSEGNPKLIYRTCSSWTDFFDIQNRIFKINSDSSLYFHGSSAFSGNLNMILAFLYKGAFVKGTSKMSPSVWKKEISEFSCDHIYMIPSKLAILTKNKIVCTCVKSILSGSELISEKEMQCLKTQFPNAEIILYYGSAEFSYVSYLRNPEVKKSLNCIGKPFPEVNVSVCNGEIFVESPFTALGLTKPYSCGDRGFMNDKGELFFCGRKQDVFSVKGNAVHAQRIKQIFKNIKGVENVCIIPFKTENGKNKIAAFIVKSDTFNNTLMKKVINTELHSWERPSRYIFVSEISLNSTGKINKKALYKLLENSNDVNK